MELKRAGTVIPFCDCGDCTITISEQSGSNLENVNSSAETTMTFVNPDVYVDDCELARVKGRETGWKWVD